MASSSTSSFFCSTQTSLSNYTELHTFGLCIRCFRAVMSSRLACAEMYANTMQRRGVKRYGFWTVCRSHQLSRTCRSWDMISAALWVWTRWTGVHICWCHFARMIIKWDYTEKKLCNLERNYNILNNAFNFTVNIDILLVHNHIKIHDW